LSPSEAPDDADTNHERKMEIPAPDQITGQREDGFSGRKADASKQDSMKTAAYPQCSTKSARNPSPTTALRYGLKSLFVHRGQLGSSWRDEVFRTRIQELRHAVSDTRIVDAPAG
jgi:hypothetical protein